MTFRYQYSASAHKEVEAIRQKYLPQTESKLDELKRLDRKVQSAGTLSSLIAGITSCLLFGLALCIMLGSISGNTILAVVLALLGSAGMITAYPLFRRIAKNAKAKYTPRILLLIREIDEDRKS